MRYGLVERSGAELVVSVPAVFRVGRSDRVVAPTRNPVSDTELVAEDTEWVAESATAMEPVVASVMAMGPVAESVTVTGPVVESVTAMGLGVASPSVVLGVAVSGACRVIRAGVGGRIFSPVTGVGPSSCPGSFRASLIRFKRDGTM